MPISMIKSNIFIAIIVIGIFAFIGFAIGTFKIPDSSALEITKKAGRRSN